jgi:hypothetical protein
MCQPPGAAVADLVGWLLKAFHTWAPSADTNDARLFTTAAIVVAACAGKSAAVGAFADACVGFGECEDNSGLGPPLKPMPFHDAYVHWSYCPRTAKERRAELVAAIVRSLLHCRSTSLRKRRLWCVPPYISHRRPCLRSLPSGAAASPQLWCTHSLRQPRASASAALFCPNVDSSRVESWP